MSTFRRYGGLNYSATNSITRSYISNSEQTNINNYSGQPNSKEVFASHVDLSGNSILHTGTIYFQDGTFMNTAPNIGSTGTQGAPGSTGAQGGSTGYTGAQGTAGGQGAQGAQGGLGIGLQGPQGAKGATGTQGSIGSQGATGSQGYTGPQGVQGYTGVTGVQGARGVGSQGPQGTQGDYGGPPGPPGSIYFFQWITGSSGNPPTNPTPPYQPFTLFPVQNNLAFVSGNLVVIESPSNFSYYYGFVNNYIPNATPSAGEITITPTSTPTIPLSGAVTNIGLSGSIGSTGSTGTIGPSYWNVVSNGQQGTTGATGIYYAKSVSIGFNSYPQYTLDVDSANSGTVGASTFTATSDYRLKQNIENLDLYKHNTDGLRPVIYTYIPSGKVNIGLIAHELQEYYPFLVEGHKDGENKQSINYIGLIGVLIKEIQ